VRQSFYPQRHPKEFALDQVRGAAWSYAIGLAFADLVREAVTAIDPAVGAIVRVTPSLQDATERERRLYLSAMPVTWPLAEREEFLRQMGVAGHAVENIDPKLAFEDVRLIRLECNDLLIEAGTPAALVYIPLDAGLRVLPLGGYEAMTVAPRMPLGVTGVIRGAVRNSSVVAEQSVRVLMIPKSVYMKRWHRTLSPDELRRMLAPASADWVATGPAAQRRSAPT